MTTAALIVAGGRGVRAGGDLPKQYRMLAGKSVINRTLNAFLAHPAIDQVMAVIGADDASLYAAAAPQHERLAPPAVGGETRQESVRRGLSALAALGTERVLIHDAVRPFFTAALIDRVVHALDSS